MVKAFIFDVDGVLVNSPHERAWGETLRELMEADWTELARAVNYDPQRYTTEVYQSVVAGKPRAEGAAALLAFFGVTDPDGTRCDLLCKRKQEMIERLIRAGDFEAFDDALRFLIKSRNAGVLLAAASSSKNANDLMSRVNLYAFCGREKLPCHAIRPGDTLLEAFDANVCGREFRSGKPDPEIFLCAAELLRTPPENCAVFEDAVSGVHAAKAGGMLCVGIARNNDQDLLTEAGADMVVATFDQIDPEAVIRLR